MGFFLCVCENNEAEIEVAGVMKDLDINQVPAGAGEEVWTAVSLELDDEDLINMNSGPPRKKLRLTKEQSRLLEESFRQNHTLNPVRPPSLSSLTNLCWVIAFAYI